MTLFVLGFICGIAFSIAWVFLWVAIDVAHAAGRKWSWKHGFAKHAAYLQLEEDSKVRQWNHDTLFRQAIQAAAEMTQEERDVLFGPRDAKPDNKASSR